MEGLKRRVDNSPVPAARSASVLTQLLFGVSALALACFSCWCLGWFGMDAGANALCLAGVLVTGLYGFCLVRYYRGLHMPKVEGAFKGGATVAWIVLVAVAARCMMVGSALLTPMALLTLMYLFFAFMGVLISRGQPRQLWLVAASTLAGLIGWGLVEAMVLCCIAHYSKAVFGNVQVLDLFPGWYQQVLSFLEAHLGILAMLLGGILLILVDWWLRLKVYSLRSGEPIRSFFTWWSWGAIASFVAAVVFSQIALGVIERRISQVEGQISAAGVQGELGGGLSEWYEGQLEFATLQQEFGRQLAVATPGDQDPATRSPFMWKRETARRWLPAPATPEEHAQLTRYLAQVQPVLDGLPAMLEKKPPVAIFSPGLFLILRWRMEAAIQQDDLETALACFVMVSQMAMNQLDAPDLRNLMEAVGRLDEVAQMAERLLEGFPGQKKTVDEAERQLLACRGALQKPPREMLKAMLEEAASRTRQLKDDDGKTGGVSFGKVAWIAPQPQMLVDAEYHSIVQWVVKIQSWADLEQAPAVDGPYVRYLKSLLIGKSSIREVLRLAESRLNAELLLVGMQRYRMAHDGRFPTALPELVPECMGNLPEDPLAPERPYAVTQEKLPVEVWNFQSQAVETHTLPAFVVRSSVDPAICAIIMLRESEAPQERVEAP
ncbi:MAG: hypothetical protein II943_05000 [Victivallales bacterium]|nr:hypothetical protein [Victivallales bacterium]